MRFWIAAVSPEGVARILIWLKNLACPRDRNTAPVES